MDGVRLPQQTPHDGTGRGKVAIKDGLYVVSSTAQQHQQQHHQQTIGKVNAAPSAAAVVNVEPIDQSQQQPHGPFYLHNPCGVNDDPVKDIFTVTDKTATPAKSGAYVIAAASAPPPPPPPAVGLNTMTGKTWRLLLGIIIIIYVVFM